MRIAKGVEEDGVIVGNTYDKYGSKNPLVGYLMRGFETALEGLVAKTGVREIHEVGCGEGYWTLGWLRKGYEARGSDFSTRAVELARLNAEEQGLPANFKVSSIYDLQSPADAAPLMVCCEVLEHLERPELALDVLKRLASPYLIASVPREPLWRALNLARGRYGRNLGNTPGHIQHWSKADFVEFIEKEFEVLDIRSPLPWTMVLAKQKRRGIG
jgi:SAM-dependent methyltransferase